jgi:integrase
VLVLKDTETWGKVKPKKTKLMNHEFENWFKVVMGLENPVNRDYLLFIAFTGMRATETRKLKWDRISFDGKLLITNCVYSKNNEPLCIPLSDVLIDLLSERKKLCGSSEFVFPGEGLLGHIDTPKRAIDLVKNISGLTIKSHDLRRTFTTTAESLDISTYAVKTLVNHGRQRRSGDVTEDYIVWDVERLREPMQRITNKILELAKVKKPVNFVVLPKEKKAGKTKKKSTVN